MEDNIARSQKEHLSFVQIPLFVVSKVCRVCKIDLPIDQFYQANREKDGLRWECKECHLAEKRQAYLKTHPRKHLPPASNGVKICRTCRIEKPVEQFNKNKKAGDRLSSQCKCNLTHTLAKTGRYASIPEHIPFMSVMHLPCRPPGAGFWLVKTRIPTQMAGKMLL